MVLIRIMLPPRFNLVSVPVILRIVIIGGSKQFQYSTESSLQLEDDKAEWAGRSFRERASFESRREVRAAVVVEWSFGSDSLLIVVDGIMFL